MRFGFTFALTASLFALARSQCDGDGLRRRSGNSVKIDLPLPENIEKAKTILDKYPVVDGLVKFLKVLSFRKLNLLHIAKFDKP